MKEIILYPPNGGKDGVVPHPMNVEKMKKAGWVEQQEPKVKLKEKQDGSK